MAEAAPQSKSYGLTNQVSNESEHFKPEAGRYHLYIAHACPFALRAHLALRLKGLEDIITLSVVHPITEKTKPEVDDHVGWVFRKPDDEPLKTVEGKGPYSCRGCIPDTINNAKTIRELYEISGNAPTVYSVPLLWDKKLKTVVNNESAQLIRIFNSGFNELAKNPKLDLYPEALRTKIDETNNWILSDFDGKIFKTAQAQNQKDYEENANAVFVFLDKLEEILSKSRYLVGDQITEADVRLFPNLVRFDEAYHVIFKLNKKRIVDYPNILNYLRDFYQTPGIAETVDMEHIKISTFNKFPLLNPYGIIPIGPDFVGELKQKHNREKL